MAEEESTQIQRNQIKRRRLPPRSDIWDHFRRGNDGHGKEIATCKRCGKVYAYHGTKNLLEHYDKGCVGQEESDDAGAAEQPPQALPIPSLAQDEDDMQQHPPLQHPSVKQQQEEASKHLARMIALGGYDASVLEDDHFRSFVRSLNPEFKVPSRVEIENRCVDIFGQARKDDLDRLTRSAPGKVNVAVGRAIAMDEEVLYVACQFIDDGWNLHSLMLHACVITDHHVDDSQIIVELLDSQCMFSKTEYVKKVFEKHANIGCRLFMVAYETTDNVIDPATFEEGGLCPKPKWGFATYVDNVLHSIARSLIPEDFTRGLLNGVDGLGLTRQERLELFARLDLHCRCACAFDEHWYALYCSLKVLFNHNCQYFVPHCIAKPLCKVLEEIYRAIQKISSSTGPTANLCLAELFKLRDVLQDEVAQSRNVVYTTTKFKDEKSFTFVLEEASDTLDKAIKDPGLAWSLPYALDPRYKLTYIASNFERAYGLKEADEYIKKVTEKIRDLYSEYVKQYGTKNGAGHSVTARAMDTSTSADDQMEQAGDEQCHSQQGMATQVSSSYLEAETELDRYLKHPPDSDNTQAEGFDILNWWKAHSSEYPMVARMARDALAMPTCSKLSSYQMAQLRSILRGYSKKPYRTNQTF